MTDAVIEAINASVKPTLDELRQSVKKRQSAEQSPALSDNELRTQAQTHIHRAVAISLAAGYFDELIYNGQQFDAAFRLAYEKFGVSEHQQDVWTVWKTRSGFILQP